MARFGGAGEAVMEVKMKSMFSEEFINTCKKDYVKDWEELILNEEKEKELKSKVSSIMKKYSLYAIYPEDFDILFSFNQEDFPSVRKVLRVLADHEFMSDKMKDYCSVLTICRHLKCSVKDFEYMLSEMDRFITNANNCRKMW